MRPSLLIIPANETSGVLMPQIPFNGTADFTVSRTTTPANNSTRVNSSGLIEIVNDNVPRIDYLNQSCPALLVEPSAQNLTLQSAGFEVSGTWALVSGGTGSLPVVSANAVISPDGTQNAETVVFNRGAGNASADQSSLQQYITIPTSGTYTFSVYAKASAAGDVGKQIFIRLGGAGGLIAITLTANWVRYSSAETSVASGSQIVQIGNRGTFTASNSVSVDLWGAQVETGSIATSYIPTTTTTGSRAADVISASGALVSGLIGQTEGTIYAEVDVRNFTQTDRPIIQLFLDSNNRILLEAFFFSPTFGVKGSVITSGSSVANITFAITNSGIYKIALAYKQNDFAFFVNGTLRGADTLGNLPSSLNAVHLGHNNGSSQLSNYIRAAALYTTRLSNNELQLLTKL